MGLALRIKREAHERLARATRQDRTGIGAGLLRKVTGQADNSYPAFWFTGRRNFGDIVSPVILKAMLDIEPVRVSKGFRGKLLGAGSILAAATPGDVVCGSGLLEPKRFDGRAVTFVAVRGPRSRALIDGDVPEVYGDPGALLPLIYEPLPAVQRHAVGLVPHYHDKAIMTAADSSVVVIDIEDPDWRATVDRIASCDVIISSSLHGIIVAEAYGKPAVWVQPTDALRGGEFKFHDYYEGTDREAGPADWDAGVASLVARAELPRPMDLGPSMSALDRVRAIIGNGRTS